MKFEYINLLNEANVSRKDVTIDDFLSSSITYEYYLKRFTRDAKKIGSLIGTQYIRDCRTRIINFHKQSSQHVKNVSENGENRAVANSYAIGEDLVYVISAILKDFCIFDNKNKNKNFQFILKNLTENEDRTITISDRTIDDKTTVSDLNKSGFFFVFDAKDQYRYGKNGLTINAVPKLRQSNTTLGGRHVSNILLTSDTNFEKYSLFTLSSLLNYINAKINRKTYYKWSGDKEVIKARDFNEALKAKSPKKLYELVKKLLEVFGDFNKRLPISILKNYKKISWDDFDELKSNISEETLKNTHNANLDDRNLRKNTRKGLIKYKFLGNRFNFVGYYPSDIDRYLSNKKVKENDRDEISLQSTIDSLFSYFKFYAEDCLGEGNNLSVIKKMVDWTSSGIRDIFNRHQYPKFTKNQSEDERDRIMDEIDEKLKKELENCKLLEALDRNLSSIIESFSLLKSSVLTGFKASIDTVKDFLQNDGFFRQIVASVRDWVEQGVKNTISEIEDIKVEIGNQINEIKQEDVRNYLNSYEFKKFNSAIKKFEDNAFNYKKSVWYSDISELQKYEQFNVVLFVATNYNQPDKGFLDSISIANKIKELYSKSATEENNGKVDEVSNATIEYLNKENENDKSDKNDNDDDEEGGAPVPVNDSYIIRKGDRVYDSSYLHQIVKGRFNVSRNTTLNESKYKKKELKHQWDQAYNFLKEAVDNLPARRKFKH